MTTNEPAAAGQPREQRRSRAIAMSAEELDTFLGGEHTCRVATVSATGEPHVAPLWFVWVDGALWLNSLVRSQRWTDLGRDPRIAVVVDAGTDYRELRGVEIKGRAEAVGDVPRSAEPDPRLTAVESAYARKYSGTDAFAPDGRHGWLRIRPEKVTSWDFRKNAALRRP
jgi:nitroimidazol reductase NimA-like FMN-containing flavoprotein (pyridoxamine 5'-phosphate oxidase superfamily)